MIQLLRETTAYRSLKRDEENGTLAATVLVLFPDGKNLRPLLKECAKAILGARDGSREAGLIDRESYSDCLFYPAEGGKLTAEDGAKIVEECTLRPVEGKKKLVVLDRFHTVTPLVQNKLLKVLEEPPESVYFLLGAESEFPVLPTVRSRAKKYQIPPFSEEQIFRALERNYTGKLKEAASASGGIYSVAESFVLENGEQFRLAARFLTESPSAFAREMSEYKEKREFFSALGLLLRDMLFYRMGRGKYASLSAAKELSASFETGAILKSLELVIEAEKQIQFNANFAQCLYALALQIEKEKIKWQRLS